MRSFDATRPLESPEKCDKQAATLLKEAGIPAAVVMEMIGHDSEQMSEHYTHVGSEALKKAAESLPDVTQVQAF